MSIPTHIEELENSGLVRLAQMEPEIEYLFRHALVQEAAYDSILKSDRRHLHATVAQTLEQLHSTRLDEFAATLADHYERAENYPQALEYYLRAGKAAAKVYANTEAALLFSRAIELLAIPETKSATKTIIDLFSQYGRVLELSGKFEAAIENYRQMQAEAIRRREKQMEMDALIAQAIIQATPSPTHNISQAQGLCEQALTIAHALENREAESRIYWILLLVNYFGQDNAKSIEYGKKSLEIARAINHRERMAFTLNDIARSYYTIGDIENAARANREARALWEELGNMPMLADNLAGFAEANLLSGDFKESLALAQRAYEISQQINNAWGKGYALSIQAQAYWYQGHIAACLQCFEQMGELNPHKDLPFVAVMGAALLMDVYTEMGMPDRADETIEGIRYIGEIASESFSGFYELSKAYIAGARGDISLMHSYFEAAQQKILRLSFNTLAPLYIGAVEYRDLMELKAYTEAAEKLAKTIKELQDSHIEVFIPLLRYWRATALIYAGQAEDARAELIPALKLGEQKQTRHATWKIHAALAEISTDEKESTHHLQSAREIVQYITDHAPQDLRASYLNLPEVQKVMSRTA